MKSLMFIFGSLIAFSSLSNGQVNFVPSPGAYMYQQDYYGTGTGDPLTYSSRGENSGYDESTFRDRRRAETPCQYITAYVDELNRQLNSLPSPWACNNNYQCLIDHSKRLLALGDLEQDAAEMRRQICRNRR
ncbi:MAG: hypothetical protein EOP06_26660 [Proteobacteria bacterium]|nr:MAG: hypothetical protein EOP06_26660 [Pseudomonadota bacterium]